MKIVVDDYPYYASDCIFCEDPSNEKCCKLNGNTCHLTNFTTVTTPNEHSKCELLTTIEDIKKEKYNMNNTQSNINCIYCNSPAINETLTDRDLLVCTCYKLKNYKGNINTTYKSTHDMQMHQEILKRDAEIKELKEKLKLEEDTKHKINSDINNRILSGEIGYANYIRKEFADKLKNVFITIDGTFPVCDIEDHIDNTLREMENK